MHLFNGITRDWLTAVSRNDLDLIVQVFETEDSDALADIFTTTALDFDVQVFNIEFQPNAIADPLDLIRCILYWFGEQYGHDEIERLIDICAYAMHADVFKAWYWQRAYFRQEPLLYEEAGYECQEFYLALGRILSRLSRKKPFAVLIKNLDWAPRQVLMPINQLLDYRNRRQFWGVIGFVEHSGKLCRLQEDNVWQDCLRRLERQGLIMPMSYPDVSTTYPWYRPVLMQQFDQLHRMLQSAVDMFGFSDVIRIVSQVRQYYNDQRNGQLLFFSAFSSLMSRNIDDAIRDFNKVQNRLQATKNLSILASSYFWQSICYALKSQEKLARGAQEQCEKLAMEYNDPRDQVLSQFADLYINIHIAQNKVTQPALNTISKGLQRFGYDNLQAMLQSQVNDQTSSRQHLKQCVIALRMARGKKNMLAFSRALHSMGLIHMRLGNVRQTHRLYDLSLKILEKYQNSVDIVPMLNSQGYFLVCQEEWRKSWSIFDRAMSLAIRHRNFNEGSTTLYNFVRLFSQSGSIQRALDMLNDLLELLRIRNVATVSYNNQKDLFILKGWFHCLLRQPIQARYCLTQIQRLSMLKETAFSMILYLLLKARIAQFEREPAQALNELKLAHEALSQTTLLDLYQLMTLKMEVARMYMDLGQSDDAHLLFAFLRKKAHEYGLNTMAQRISRASLGINNLTDSLVPDISQPYHVLLDLAQKETQLIHVQQELSDIHQVNLLVGMSASEPNMESFLQQTIEILDRRIPADEFGLWMESELDSEQTTKLMLTNNVSATTRDLWQNWLQGKPRAFQYLYNDSKFINAWPLMMETLDTGWLIVSGDDQQHEVWNVTFLQLVAQQLGLILDRRLREAYLEHQNKTDLLTGVLNRSGLYERLKKLFASIHRHPDQPFVLCYFDLDHFKYFNDQFGHELGDQVLKALVRKVNGQLRGKDEFGRVGGDEFIILLSDTKRDAAERLVERLRKSIAEPDWWLPLIVDKYQGVDNPVPKEEWITASFGVVTIPQWPESGVSRIDLIAQGDAAMYKAKNMGRNCVVIQEFVTGAKRN